MMVEEDWCRTRLYYRHLGRCYRDQRPCIENTRLRMWYRDGEKNGEETVVSERTSQLPEGYVGNPGMPTARIPQRDYTVSNGTGRGPAFCCRPRFLCYGNCPSNSLSAVKEEVMLQAYVAALLPAAQSRGLKCSVSGVKIVERVED